ncbi:phosphosulfolactate synthase [Niallia sp. Krafla_26]|uniref:phosphosulfolactate synthase n=1 Tax=Niallia sp. Krafla_26 TaxID=3064703 RepID=UPI003D1867E9
MDFLTLPKRTNGERQYGLTSIIDLGISIGELGNILRDYHSLIDIAKIGIGSAYVTPNLKEKIQLYKEYGIKTYCGGTLFEKAYSQNKVDEYLTCIDSLGVQWVEVSNGTFPISLEDRCEMILKIKRNFHVLAEVGSKDSEEDMSLLDWKNEINQLFAVGSAYVITEGRDSGTSGIYQKNGNVRENLISELVNDLDVNRIIFEAPTPKQQMYFINEIGANVNLGNVKIHDVLQLESQRRGLRSETFYLEEAGCKLPL